ncbi:hypothetical protein ABS784_09845 [Geobacillus sp. G4]|uniref:Uncharacterized protein n=5 Tax=Geobacillus TaxID=129337 RepID=Q5KZC1_GEOKA|nr:MULTISPECIES: hypothetical protein [Geobacillus]ATA59964.1 hypothetical protein GS458_1515 [Geobacillus stearothermophilus]AEV19250.1 hypothetical protein GTCCBUS3UF5_19410 [Geobacillus thermoleovorans CCB_US3_UF5]AMV10899.1 hypothetical protein GT3570_08070 [Geobacillus thermoleovorans]AOL34516.1 hypothetical protein BGM21_08340 [Geobacillus thermoleovorans]AUI35400.1 hypothetical protein CWI35_01715 [[Bacillus] caldolyticus]
MREPWEERGATSSLPRYTPGIGVPDEMSPIRDIARGFENGRPPVMEVTPADSRQTADDIDFPPVDRAF